MTVFDLDTLAPVGEVANVRANGAVVDAKSGHGFASSKPVTMSDTKTLTVLKTIDVGENTQPDGIDFDPFNERVYVFSHPTADATVIDAKDGTLLGTIDLGGAPEQGTSDGQGHLYVSIQDKANVAVVDVKTMKVTAHYGLEDKGSRCNGLAVDGKNRVLFVACSASGPQAAAPQQPGPPAQSQPAMVILNADSGKIITSLPLAGGSDGAVFNPATMEAFSSHGNGTMTNVKENSPTSFAVEQNLDTMAGAKCLTLDTKTNHILTDPAEYAAPAQTPTPGGGGPPAADGQAAGGGPPEGRGQPGAGGPPGAGGFPGGGFPGGGGRGGRGGRGAIVPGSFSILMVGE